MIYIFSSRRQPLSTEQLDSFALHFGDGTPMERRIDSFDGQLWSATENHNADALHNIGVWNAMIIHAARHEQSFATVLGDFPHAAIEALNAFKTDRLKVYVRIYEIGGGFVRDTKFLRWAQIK